MKKVLLSSVAVLSLAVAGAIVYADGNSGANTGVNNSDVVSTTVNTDAPFVVAPSEDSLPEGPYTNKDDKTGQDVTVGLQDSQDLTNPGKDTYKDNFGHREGVEGARTNGSDAYKHDQEFEASKAKAEDKAAAPMDADAKAKADKAEAAAAKMGEKSADKAAAKTLPNTAVAK